jgi:N-acetylglucosamine-6-sulfatase
VLAKGHWRVRALLVALALVVVGGIVLASRTVRPSGEGVGTHTRPEQPVAHNPVGRPNIVFVLTDDLSLDLLRYMPHVLAMQRAGLTFKDYFVSDSLCCPSRASIFTGNFPHDTHIFGNFGADGGFREFFARGEDDRSFAVALHRAGYLTGMMGKYLNGYLGLGTRTHDGSAARDAPVNYIPPGWTEWDVGGWGYPEFNYTLNEDGTLVHYGRQPSDYLTDVIARKGVSFIDRAAQQDRPFFLELATFAPHSPYTPAPRDARDFPGLKAPRPPSFDVMPTNAPKWLAAHPPLTAAQIAKINKAFRRRAQAVQAVDQMIASIEETLAADGVARNTYVIFSSDNGLHTGEYRLTPGKLTAFDTDIHVPLVVTGPGVPADSTTAAMSENIDLAKTFAGIAGTTLPSDGHSLLPLLRGKDPRHWRDAILVEHHGGIMSVRDPDYQQSASGSPTTYEAMRTHQFLYVEYADGEREFYDLRADPFELDNLAPELTKMQLRALHGDLRAIERCHNGRACWAAMHLHHKLGEMPKPGLGAGGIPPV